MPGLLSWVVTVIRVSKYEASDVFLGPGSNTRHPLSVFPSLHRVLRDQFPGFISSIRVLRHPTAISPHFVSFAWRYPGCTRCFAPRQPSAPSRPGVVHPVLQPGICRGGMLDLPSSRGISIVRLHMFPSDSGRTARTRPLRCSSVALGM